MVIPIVFLILFCLSNAQARLGQRGKRIILDMHCHAAGMGAGNSGCFISPAMRDSYKFSFYLKAFNVTREELLQKGDGLIIRRLSEGVAASRSVSAAIVLALDGVVDNAGNLDSGLTELYVPNAFVKTETDKYDNLYFGASVHPRRKNATGLVKKWAAVGARLIKWLPPIQNIDPSDESNIPFYQALVESGLPLLVHTGNEKAYTRSNEALCDPALLELPLRMGITVIAAHVATTGKTGGQPNHERLIPMLSQYPNLYSDISSLTQVNKKPYLKPILQHRKIIPKLIFGTDAPLINTVLVSPWFNFLSLSWKKISRINGMESPWDRDVALKRALGVPESVFTNAEKVFPEIYRDIREKSVGPLDIQSLPNETPAEKRDSLLLLSR